MLAALVLRLLVVGLAATVAAGLLLIVLIPERESERRVRISSGSGSRRDPGDRR